jgi:hypothetical protein
MRFSSGFCRELTECKMLVSQVKEFAHISPLIPRFDRIVMAMKAIAGLLMISHFS